MSRSAVRRSAVRSTGKPYTETRLKEHLVKILKEYDKIYYRKMSDRFRAGIPDFYIIYAGKHIWIEFKIIPKKPTPIQNHEIAKIVYAGGRVFVLSANKQGTMFELDPQPYQAPTKTFASLDEVLMYIL